MAPRAQALPEPSKFEPGIVKAAADAINAQAPEQLAEVKKAPKRIIVDESIGWMEGGILCQFREDQLVENPADIVRIIQHGGRYSELK